MLDVVTFGEAMVSIRFPGRLDRGALGRPFVVGAESNQAIGLTRLGHRVRWCSRVGADSLGSLILRQLRGEGVDVDCEVTDQAATGAMFVEDRSADRLAVTYRRAGSAASTPPRAAVLAAIETRPTILSVTGITPALSAAAAAVFTEAIQAARASGVLVSLDVNYRAKLWSPEAAGARLRPLLPLVDVLIASEDELTIVAEGAEDQAVANLLALGIDQVVVKRGSAGATAYTATGRFDQSAISTTAIDVIGAGDAFVAGYLSGILDNLDVPGRLRRGAGLGSWCVGSIGDWEGLPTRAELGLAKTDVAR